MTLRRSSHGSCHEHTGLPFVFDYDELLCWFYFLEREATSDEVKTALGRLGPAQCAAFLVELEVEGLLPADAAHAAVTLVSTRLTSPCEALDHDAAEELSRVFRHDRRTSAGAAAASDRTRPLAAGALRAGRRGSAVHRARPLARHRRRPCR